MEKKLVKTVKEQREDGVYEQKIYSDGSVEEVKLDEQMTVEESEKAEYLTEA